MPRPLFSWIAPTPEVVRVARKTHAPGKARNPEEVMPHAAEAPAQPAVKSEPSAPMPVPATDDQTVAIEQPEAVEVSTAIRPTPAPIDVVALLATNNGEREDLKADQALPPRFAVVGHDGRAIARFHGCEHATHANHVLGGRVVIRIEDGQPMTGVR